MAGKAFMKSSITVQMLILVESLRTHIKPDPNPAHLDFTRGLCSGDRTSR
jgi:hypothetical protein